MLTPNSTLQHGRYRIIRPIGQGGMGAVYEAYDNNLRNHVALKEALVGEANFRRAFEREAQRLDRLRHVALPSVKDHFTEGGGQYLVMEYIEGQDLNQMLKQRKQPFPVSDVLSWANTLLDALAYLHQEGVIHRDIKPANIKLTPKGQIILLDFGLAKGGITRQTLVGRSVYGYTPGYAPPEQIEGQPTDERSDLYALGATLYALLTGQAPDDPISRRKYMERGLPDLLLPANQVNPQVPSHVAKTLQRATALEPAERPDSATQMRSMLNPSPTRLIAPRPATTPPPLAAQPPRLGRSSSPSQPVASQSSVSAGGSKRLPLLLGLIVAFVLLMGAAYLYGRNSNNNNEPVIVVVTTEPASTDEAIAVPPTELANATATATGTLGVGATSIAQTDGMVQVYVPEGDFEMGASDDDPDASEDEKPRHTVYLDAFWIDQTEVTNAMFAGFLNERGNQEEGDVTWLHAEDEDALIEEVNGTFQPKSGFANHPVVEVSWYGANAYCEWAERRLPTEAEWEKAAGGILTKEETRKYPWGNDAPTGARLNFCDQNCTQDNKDSSTNDGYKRTSPVGNYPAGASPYGALDMASNVWEWVEDFYDSNYYASSPRENPTGPSPSSGKAHRGGSWYDSAPTARVHNRNEVGADFRDEVAGFRCARSP